MTRVFSLLATLVLLTFPLVVRHTYYVHLGVMILISAIACSGLNLVTGYAGQLSLGHAAFVALGAYSSALLTTELGWSVGLSFLASLAITTAFGLVIGVPSFRLRGPYLALATAGFGEIVRVVITNWEGLTHGSRGVTDIPAPGPLAPLVGLAREQAWYYVCLLCFALVITAIQRIIRSHVGRDLVAVRDSDRVAEALGINTFACKLLAFSMSALAGGWAGVLYSHYMEYVSPDAFTFGESVAFLSMVVVGGKGTVWGPLVGAIVLTVLPDLLSFLQDFKMLFHGLLLVLAMMFLPGGIVDTPGQLLLRRSRRSTDEPVGVGTGD